MWTIINHTIKSIIPYMPKSFIKVFANRYVAGIKLEETLKKIKELNSYGFSATIDILGEHTKDKNEAYAIAEEYANIYNCISKENLNCNISIKLSHIGLDLGLETCAKNLDLIINAAKDNSNFLRIDMESSLITDDIINLYNKSKKKYNRIGTVFQAYLYRTMRDIKQLDKGSNFRVCKGIYKEDKSIAFSADSSINENFLKIVEYAFINDIYIGIATHNPFLLEKIYLLIDKHDVSKEMFEFQVLYGVPMEKWLKKHTSAGYKIRVYVPFGKSWYEYSIRRLKENPNIAGYILKNLFKK